MAPHFAAFERLSLGEVPRRRCDLEPKRELGDDLGVLAG
jgi:hypothetical protein